MNNQYIWQSTDLYQLTWQDSVASTLLSEVSLLRGKLLGRLSMFGFKEQGDSVGRTDGRDSPFIRDRR